MAKPMLPDVRLGTSNQKSDWTAGSTATGVFDIGSQQAKQNLIWNQGLRAPGVSHPIATAQAFAWRLTLGDDDPPARTLLRFLLQMQFLGAVEHTGVELSGSALKRVVGESARSSRLYIWRARGVKLDAGILGGSFGLVSEFPLFPSATFQESPAHLAACVEAVARSRSDVAVVGGSLQFVDPAQGERFKSLVARLAQDLPETSPWRTALKTIAGRASEAPAFAPLPGLIPPDGNRLRWECPQHASHTNGSWIEDCAGKTVKVSATQPELRCPIHKDVPLRDEAGNAIGPEQLGAALLPTAVGRELIIWTDIQRPPQLTSLATESSALSFSYWHSNGPRIRLEGRVIGLKDITSRSQALPVDEPNTPSHSLALKPDFLGLLADRNWDPVEARWKVRLWGRSSEDTLEAPSSDATVPADGVVVWPATLPSGRRLPHPSLPAGSQPAAPGADSGKQSLSGSIDQTWTGDVVAAYFRYLDDAALVTDRVGKSGPYLHVESFRRLPFLSTSDGRVAFIALRKDSVDVGVIPVTRQTRAIRPERAGYVAIDFGTSNSTVLYRADGDNVTAFVKQGVENAAAHCSFPCAGTTFADTLDELLLVYSAWFRQEKPASMFGSLLLEREGERGYSILPRQPDLLRRFTEGKDMRLHHNIKWSNPTPSVGERLEKYLSIALARAFHDLKQNGCHTVHVAATYPLAFDKQRIGHFERAVGRAVRTTASFAGINAGTTALFSESSAGIAVTGGEIADYALTIDLGGGTTDLAIVSDRGKQAHAVDSLRIGGRGLLQSVIGRANATERQGIETSLGLAAMRVPPMVALESVLQSNPRQVALDLTPATNQIRVRQAVAAMFAAVVVAAVRLVRTVVRDKSTSVNVVLLGQGWELLRQQVLGPFDEQWFIEALSAHASQHCSLKQTSTVHGAERKLALVRGALRILRPETGGVSLTEPPVKLGMDLQGRTTTYQASQSVGDVSHLDLATGDPGFGGVIDELIGVMTRSSGPGRELGNIVAELARIGPSGIDVRQHLINQGVNMLVTDLVDEGQLRSSPLMRFLDVCWQQHWAPDVSEPVSVT